MKKIATLVLLLLLVACQAAPAATPAAPTSPAAPTDTPRIAVISAFDSENALLLEKTQKEKVVTKNGIQFTLGKLPGKDVVLVLSGVSMINAAMTTQLTLDSFHISRIIFSGIAGGVNPNLTIGDVVVPAKWGEYLESHFARETDGKYVVPDYIKKPYPNFLWMFPQTVAVLKSGLDKPEEKFWFDADPEMVALAAKMTPELSKCSSENVCLDRQPVVKVGGNGVSGQAFVDNAKFRDYAWATFQADALDMETAAVAHVAYVNGVPYLAFRSLSDLAGGGTGENQINTFFKLAANNSASVMLAFLQALK
jgi:adenosylhomocysteine nucleosidase